MKPILYSLMVYAAMSAAVPVRVAPTASLAWDPVTKDTAGNPDVISSYFVALWPTGTDPSMPPLSSAMVIGTSTSQILTSLLATVPNGTAIDVRVRATDEAGNTSEWSDPVAAIIDKIAPAKPGGCRLVK